MGGVRVDLAGFYGKVGYREGGGREEAEEGERSHQENEREAAQRQLVKRSVSRALSREIRLDPSERGVGAQWVSVASAGPQKP